MGTRGELQRAEVERHLRRAAQGGQGLAAYARANGLAKHVLYDARSRARRKPGAFVRVQTSIADPLPPIAIRLPNGIELTMTWSGDLPSLLRTLSAP